MGFKFRRSKPTQPSSPDPDSDDEPMQGKSFKYRVNSGGGGNLQPAGSFDQPHLPQHSAVGGGGRAASAPRQRPQQTRRPSANQPASGRRRRASSGRRASGGPLATKVSTDEQTDVTAPETLADSEANHSDDDENDAASSSSGGSSNEYNPYIGSKASRIIPEDEMSYPSVGSKVRTTARGGAVTAPPGVSPSSRINGQDDGGENGPSGGSKRSRRKSRRSADNNKPQDASVGHAESEMKIKPPSARGMAGRVQGRQHRRSRSQGAADSGATVATSRSAPNLDSSSATVASEGSESTTEVAAMQQLAYLVVSLRSDLKEANEAREELEARVDELECGDFANGGEGSSVEVKSLKKENADLQADVDAFIAEQDDLKVEMEALKSENERLKSSSTGSSSAATGGSDARINRLEVTNEKLKDEIARLIKLNAGKSSSSAGAPSKELKREIETMKDAVKSKDAELTQANEAIERLTAEREKRDEEKKSEAAKMTLLRQRLAQVEKQKVELAEKSESLNGAVEGLRNEASGLSEERDAAREELMSARSELERVEGKLEELRDDNERLEGELMDQSTSGLSRIGDARAEELETTVSELRQSVAAQAAVVAQLEETRASLEAMVEATSNELAKSASKVATLETQLKTYQELSDEISEGTSEETVLKERVMSLASANEILRSKIENLESVKTSSEKKLKDLEESHSSLVSSNRNLENLQAKLEEDRDEAEEEIQEATDAISMLEEELDRKDVQVKDLMAKMTLIQQQLSQAEKCKAALAERNAKLGSDIDDLTTQVKILTMQKKVQGEEIETFKQLKEIADQDHEENLLVKQEHVQEVDELSDKLHQLREKSSETISDLEQANFQLKNAKSKLEAELEESSDAIEMLREALTELENAKMETKQELKELKSKLAEKEASCSTMEATQAKLTSDHALNVETISALQKMIASLEKSRDDLEAELNASSLEISELKDKVKILKSEESDESSVNLKLLRAREENDRLTGRIVELNNENDKMKREVKELGASLRLSTVASSSPSYQPAKQLSIEPASNAVSQALVSSDPVSSCDSLIEELKSQINLIVAARDAALEEASVCGVGSDGSHSTKPPPGSRMRSLPSTETHALPESSVRPPAEERAAGGTENDADARTETDARTYKSAKSSKTATTRKSQRSSADRTSVSAAPSRSSSLLEAAKKLCEGLDQKRSREGGAEDKNDLNNQSESKGLDRRRTDQSNASMSVEDQSNDLPNRVADMPVKNLEGQEYANDQDDSESAKEVKEEEPQAQPQQHQTKEKEREMHRSSSRSKGKFDIDQLTSIYFEKCGMSVSKFSDLSSDSESIRRRVGASRDIVTKKVKICRNGVFMGTYEGDLNAEGQRHGFGVLLCDNGNSYEGEWKKDKRDGLGIARYSSGDVYDGQWHRGKRQGHGVMYIEAGDTYIGSWNNGLKHGAGTYHWADGEVDVSWYEEDRRVGEGVRWNSSRTKAYRLIRGTKKDELSLDEAYTTAEKLGLNLEKFDGAP